MKVLLYTQSNEAYVELFALDRELEGVRVQFASPETIVQHIGEAEVIIAEPALIAPHLKEAKALRWVQSTFAGVDCLCSAGMRKDYILTGVKGVFGPLMSEYVLGYILLLERGLLELRARQKQQVWSEQPYRSLSGLTLGICGTGSIGQHIAQTAMAFGMKVVGWSRSGGSAPFFSEVHQMRDISQHLSGIDYLVSTLPYTVETDKIIDASVFESLSPTACFMNVGRGKTVDQEALTKALLNRSIGGAVLDVFETEPLEQTSPLWQMENVYITPHNAAVTPPSAVVSLFKENIQRYRLGKDLLHQIDWAKGY